LRLSIIKVLN